MRLSSDCVKGREIIPGVVMDRGDLVFNLSGMKEEQLRWWIESSLAEVFRR